MNPVSFEAIDRLNQTLKTHPRLQAFFALPDLTRHSILVGGLTLSLTLILAWVYYFVNATVAVGSLASILAGLATGLGALPALLYRDVSRKTLYTLLGGAAGVMLAATAFSLIVPGIQYGNQIWPKLGVYIVALGIMAGAVFLVVVDRWMPYERYLEQGESFDSLKKVWLFIAAIVLHNFPEGMAVGVSFGSGDWHNGMALAVAIGLQNIPEGLAVALPLVALGYPRQQAVFIALLSGLIEPIGGFLGVVSVTWFLPLLPIGMAFAAGAMLFVISDDIIPAAQAEGKSRTATFAILSGFIIMMILDNLLT